MRRDVKTKALRGSFVTCDARGCDAQFRTFSEPKAVDAQLETAKWTLLEVRDPKTGDKSLKHLCPTHRPLPRMEGGPPPLAFPGRTSH